ncbi:uncharacterized protein CIMG_05125 [Coccidioides immitis RS]|uniref:Uncharacterized protein n=1 Tax=Coccidioides immitis (strain RS) TaxID=246410 RepID=A0A0E1RZ72_COCIM|nr:uncharacterized protein CIMG_05125 [Coccidioides immitis RS]EAS34101.2 hypothetical protein CIMG_05125 [Coccidioides immitis RS]
MEPTATSSDAARSDATVICSVMPPPSALPTTTLHARDTTPSSGSRHHAVMRRNPRAVATVPVGQERTSVQKASTGDNNNPTTELPGGSISRASSLSTTRACASDTRMTTRFPKSTQI